MSESPIKTRPSLAAYAEDYHEENECPVPGTRTSSQVRPKKSKQDEASDSGYSSRTPATSTSGSHKIFKLVGRMTGTKKSSKETTVPPPTAPKRTVTKMSARENLRVDTNLESQREATRIQLSGEPIRRTISNRSQEKSPKLLRSAKVAPPPPGPIPIRIVPATRGGLPRPNSYHAGAPDYRNPMYNVQFSAPVHITRPIPIPQPLPTLSHSLQQPPMMYIPTPMSPNRHVVYPFMPTIPPQQISPSWEGQYHAPMGPPHIQPPPISRRFSLPIAPPVEYPVVPHRPMVYHVEQPRQHVYHEPQMPYHQVVQEEALLLEDNEAYYRRHRHQEEARRAMPPPPLPPQRPPMRHATTIATGVVRPNRNSTEYGLTPTSSRGSFSSMKEYRVPPMVRTSSSREGQIRKSDVSVSTDNARRNRPKSYIAAYDRELAAEQYQAEQGDSDRPQSLTIDAIERVNKSSKSAKSKASESGSRSSGSRKAQEAKKAAERKKVQSEAVLVEVNQGCTATVTRDANGVSVQVRSSEENKERPGRQVEREELPHRQSVSSRRESMTDAVRNILPRRPSSSQPTMRRERLEPLRSIDMEKRISDKIREMDDTAVEDDDYSEPEVLKKRGEKLTAQRLAKLKTPSETPRSARSVRSTKSNASSRKGTGVERARH